MSSTDVMLARDNLVTAALRVVTAERQVERGDYAEAGWDLEVAQELLDQAAAQLVDTCGLSQLHEAVKRARGGEAPPPPVQGFA